MNKKLLLLLCLLSFVFAVKPAHADRDAVQFGNKIHVARDTSVHDAVCFFCDVDAEGEVKGDVVVFFGDIHLAGQAHHDVVNFFGQLKAEDNVTIGQDLVSFFGSVRLGENVSVGKDMVAFFGTLHAPESVTVGNDRVVQPGWVLFGPLIFLGLIVILIVREFRGYRRRQLLRGYQYPPQP